MSCKNGGVELLRDTVHIRRVQIRGGFGKRGNYCRVN